MGRFFTLQRVFAFSALAAMAGCNGGATSPPRNAPPGLGQSALDTEFVVSGNAIYERQAYLSPGSATSMQPAIDGTKFFIKGMVYSPTPIGATPIDSPLKDSNQAIWGRDLPLMRAMGVNAIHVYNVTPPPYDQSVGPITNFLNAAWNNGSKPVYVLMSIYFTGDKLLDPGAVSALAQQYHDLAQKYAKYPAVFGITIGNEIGASNYITNPTWWQNFNVLAKAAKKGFADGGDPNKIVTTSEADGNIGAVVQGEKYGAAVDAWGVNIYRGRTFTNLYAQIQQTTSKPVMLTEYGASAAYHPKTGSTYTYGTGPNALGNCKEGSGQTSITDVAQLPQSGNPNMAGLVDYVTNNAKLLYSGYTSSGVVSGGFYFEWTDEWWKANAGNNSVHYGNVAYNGAYPGCNEDQGWYGLNAVAAGSGGLNTLSPRPTLNALKNTWANQP